MSGGTGFGFWVLGFGSERRSESAQTLAEGCEHFARRVGDGLDLEPQGLLVRRAGKSEPAGERELILQLHRATRRDLDEAAEVRLALTTAALDDVARDADCSSPHLLREPVAFFDGERRRQPIQLEREPVRQLESLQFMGITHAAL